MDNNSSTDNNFIKLLQEYKLKFLSKDLMAGLSVAAIALPQNMAYALIVGVSPIYGIYTSIMSMIIATLVSKTRYVVVGPTNMLAMAIASNLSSISNENYLSVIFLLTFLVGLFQFLLGVFKLGDLVTYVSHPVIIGLSTGAALLIGSGQLQNFLGLSLDGGINFFTEVYTVLTNLDGINTLTLSLGFFTVAMILILDKIKSELPSYLLALVISTIAVYVFNLENTLNTVGTLPNSLFNINLFFFDIKLIRSLASESLSVALLGLIQTVAVLKSLGHKSEQEREVNREFISQGIINVTSSFFSCFASAPSFTNSFANYQAGAKTRLSQFFVAATIMLFVILFSPFVKYVPIVGLSALVIVVAIRIIDIEEIKRTITTTKVDALIFLITFGAAIVMPSLDYAIYFGVLASLIVVLKESKKANVEPIRYDEESEAVKREELNELAEINDKHECIVLNLSGDLHFSTAEDLKDKLNKVYSAGENFVIRLRHIEQIDITVVKELEKFIVKVKTGDGEVTFSGVNEDNYEVLKRYGIVSDLGDEKIFRSGDELLDSTREAVEATNGEEANKKTEEQ
ncbi:SulP family inorganic anion transporter [Halanaerobacter jeridensis]|uniref:SulP family sulfate permease n=1 Tax=Halanaerobacter jeridensis TaxID=706427 RepID=A0A939BR99_9FIRM|nr:SulP family inorganic anion transporter [Halanaerobacter jeridensis]MBM7555771.1 SulP family sulfate permease [Halanaerobacter jeridensis]